ncbi:MAG: Helix-turn-helix domain, partial [Thermoplasmata archaeon]|nr:Helix-turn-helix domain [Thermoplasmata archaeon]
MRAPAERHPAQARILVVVAERPGACVQDLAEDLGITRTATLHHVRRLTREGLVRSVRHGRRVLHFLAAAQPPPSLLGLLHVHTARLVVEMLSQDPAASWRKLAKQLGITPRAVRWHIRKLEKEEALHVQPSRFGPGHVTVLSPVLRAMMELDGPPPA